jgi:ribonuclease HII
MSGVDVEAILEEISTLQFVAGVDEVGVGPLAGPVISAVVILPKDHGIQNIRDSKKLSERQREKLYLEITSIAIDWAIGRAEVEEIDKFNILQATKASMIRAVNALKIKPHKIFVDGSKPPVFQYPSRDVVDGDKLIPVISAASIIAKVTRDREMIELDKLYPGYGFAKHKGYGTVQHKLALVEQGFCPLHRKTFEPVKSMCLEQRGVSHYEST